MEAKNKEENDDVLSILMRLAGLKYVVHGILFKFCLAGMSENDLFGSDANAMKTAGNELKALVSIFNAGVASGNAENAEIRNLRLPLMSLVDFRGGKRESLFLCL